MPERHRLERELAHLDLREYQIGGATKPPTVGFEFDVHFGLIDEVVTDAGKTMPADGDKLTSHDEAADGFRVKLDGPRMEISTKPFTVDAAGKTELDQAMKNISKFAGELKQGCKSAAERDIPVPGVSGKPRPFAHSKTLISGLPLVRLPVKKAFHPTNCTVWASPQATITIPLSKVAALVKAIQSTEGKGPGVALTGDNDKNSDGTAKHWRMGLRSLALYRARDAVDKALKQLDAKRPRLILTDKREVNKTTLSQDLRGFLILLATYLWTSELTYQFDPAQARFDYEPFAKAYLPVNVKASFSEIFRKLLTPADQLVFKEVFAVGSVPSKGLGLLAPQLSTLLRQITQGAARERLFRLARPAATAADGTRKLFPPGPKELGLDSVYERQKAEFGSVPTWDDLVEHSLNSTHRGWGDRLMVPLSKPIEVNKTTPRVALELRRIGFNAVFDSRWEGLMRRVFKMVSQLNA